MITETTSADGRLPITSPRLVEALIHTVSDMAILVGETGEVEDVTCNISDLEGLDAASWVGQQIEDVVTEECEGKIRSMLRAARAGEEGRWREINHPLASGEPVPIRYQAVGAGEKVMLLGRDLRAVAQLQSRLVKAQQAMDQDYGRLRQMETRYRVLFQTSSEPLLIADAETGRIQEVNAAAARLLGADAAELTNTALARVFGDPDRTRLEGIVNRLLSTGGSESMTGFARDGETQIELGITLFRAAESMMLLCRMRSVGKRARQEAMIEQMLVGMVARMADAVVVTDLEGRVLWCNDAFLAMAEVALGEEVRGEALGRFLARPGVDMDVILTNARTHGRLRAFDSVITGASARRRASRSRRRTCRTRARPRSGS